MTAPPRVYQRDYSLMNQELQPGVKASLNAIVRGKPGVLELGQLAGTIRHQLCRKSIIQGYHETKYPQFFINWYLSGMEIGAGAWATTYFDPDLKINIMDWILEHNPPDINLK